MTLAYTNTYGPGDYIAAQGGEVPNSMQVLYKVVDITTGFAGTNTLDVGYLPKGAIPVGGYLGCVDLDTGTEALDLDVGITDNGTDGADSDFFTNGGIFTGDNAITDFPFTNAVNVRLFTGPFPKLQFAAKTKVQILCNTAANAGGTGKLVVAVFYICPGQSTS